MLLYRSLLVLLVDGVGGALGGRHHVVLPKDFEDGRYPSGSGQLLRRLSETCSSVELTVSIARVSFVVGTIRVGR